MAQGSNYSITSTSPSQLFLPKDIDCFILNTGTTTVYLDKYQGGTSGTGMPLPPNSSKTWLSGDYCYAICAPGQTGTLNVTDNGGEVVNPAAIATSLIASGLAQQIASAIYVTGTPPVDKYTLIQSTNVTAGGYSSGFVDVSGYQSLSITFTNQPGNAVDLGDIELTWYDSTGAINIGFEDFIICKGGITQINVPVRGPQYQINVVNGVGAGTLSIFGSYKALSNATYFGLGAGSANGTIAGGGSLNMQIWSGVMPAGPTTWVWQPDTVAGHCKVNFRVTTAGSQTYTILMRPFNTVYSPAVYDSMVFTTVSSSTNTDFDLVLPPIPMEIQITNTTAIALTFRVTVMNERPF